MVISMNRDDVVSFENRFRNSMKSIAVRCAQGTVWVTVAGDNTDHILSAGKELFISGKGKIVVMAEGRSTVEISGMASPRSFKSIDLTVIPTGSVCQEMKIR